MQVVNRSIHAALPHLIIMTMDLRRRRVQKKKQGRGGERLGVLCIWAALCPSKNI